MADNGFTFDAFLSHSSKDKAIVRRLAERLRNGGLRVWFDEWEIRPGDSIPRKIDEGLEQSAVLVLCMSASSLGSDWAAVESQTFRFTDPLNRDLRFIPLRLDNTEPRASLRQFAYVDWRGGGTDEAYSRLLSACRRQDGRTTPHPREAVPAPAANAKIHLFRVLEGLNSSVNAVALSANGEWAVTGTNDSRVLVWDLKSSQSPRTLQDRKGFMDWVYGVAVSANGERAISGSQSRELTPNQTQKRRSRDIQDRQGALGELLDQDKRERSCYVGRWHLLRF